MRFISEHVLEEILVRLAVKSLYRFKSVSKPWRRLIESRPFIDFYLLRHSRDYSFDQLAYMPLSPTPNDEKSGAESESSELYLPIDELKLLELPTNVNEQEEWSCVVRTLGPLSNGIYCFVSYLKYGQRVSIISAKILISNPSTHDFNFTGPLPYQEDDELYSLLTGLIDKPCRVHYGFGIGKDTYKVVVVISWGPLFSSFLSFVYNLKSGKWRKIVDYERDKRNYHDTNATDGLISKGEELRYPEITPDLELCPQRFYNGCWHWMAVFEDGTCSVMSFNVDDEAFNFMSAPPNYSFDAGEFQEMGVDGQYVVCAWVLGLKDHLGAIFFPNLCSSIHIWKMMEYGVEESWTRIYAIQPNFHGEYSRLIGIYWKSEDDNDGGNDIESISFIDGDNRTISCDEFGYQEIVYSDGISNNSYNIWFNTVGISTFMVSLEPLFL